MSGNGPITKQLHRKKNGEWSETCFGLWSRHMIGVSNGKSTNNKSTKTATTVCTGINFVKVKVIYFNIFRRFVTVLV